MTPVTITTFDWVPQFAHGHVRDLRIRWLLEEIGRPYNVDTVSARNREAAHFARQPFGQVPMIQDGDLSLFESGAILLHLAENTILMPAGNDRAHVIQWVIAALNSVEPMSLQWSSARFIHKDEAASQRYEKSLYTRLMHLQSALGDREWLVGGDFTVADLLMAEILRIPAGSGLLNNLPQLAAYVERATGRPAYSRAMEDHMAHWHAADKLQVTEQA